MREDLVIGPVLFAVDDRLGFGPEFVHAGLAGSGGGLVRGHEDPLELEELVKGPEGHEADGGGAVGIGDQFRRLARVGVDLGNHQRHVGIVPERRRVVDHHRTVLPLRQLLRPLQRKISAHRQEHHVALPSLVHIEQFHLHVAEFRFGLARGTGGPRGAEDAQPFDGERRFVETADDFFSDGSRGADDADGVHGHGGAGCGGGGGAGRGGDAGGGPGGRAGDEGGAGDGGRCGVGVNRRKSQRGLGGGGEEEEGGGAGEFHASTELRGKGGKISERLS
mmetsp:Transcript_25184/g.51356  ORF Transcript_25184/g.51356 Transcript_25184/m.51356 type:complete len:278 (+) Transcript_25184:112-945(+)